LKWPLAAIKTVGWERQQALTLIRISVIIIRHIMWVGASAPTLWKCKASSESVGAEAPTHMLLPTMSKMSVRSRASCRIPKASPSINYGVLGKSAPTV
jgi:hypothetical protein